MGQGMKFVSAQERVESSRHAQGAVDEIDPYQHDSSLIIPALSQHATAASGIYFWRYTSSTQVKWRLHFTGLAFTPSFDGIERMRYGERE